VVVRDVLVTTSRGEVRVAVAYGGAIYATFSDYVRRLMPRAGPARGGRARRTPP